MKIFITVALFFIVFPNGIYAQDELPLYSKIVVEDTMWYEFNHGTEVYFELHIAGQAFIHKLDSIPRGTDYQKGKYFFDPSLSLLKEGSPAIGHLRDNSREFSNLSRTLSMSQYGPEMVPEELRKRYIKNIYTCNNGNLKYLKFYIQFQVIYLGKHRQKIPNFRTYSILDENNCCITEEIPIYAILKVMNIIPL